MANLRNMTAHQKDEAELLTTLKGLRGGAPTGADDKNPAAPRATPPAAYEAISATYWSDRRPAPIDLILDQYWRAREAELVRKARPDAPSSPPRNA